MRISCVCAENYLVSNSLAGETLWLTVYRMRHKNGRLLEPFFFSGTAGVEVTEVFAQGWRSPWRRRVQKV